MTKNIPTKTSPLPNVTESQFYMWRTLFAMTHADNVVTEEETRFMNEAMEDIPFSPEQKSVLIEDIRTPQDIVQMFENISDKRDQAKFFQFARELVWLDGNFGKPEQEIMMKLQYVHMKSTNVDDLIGKIDLELDDGQAPLKKSPRKRAKKEMIFSFRESFLKNKFNHKH